MSATTVAAWIGAVSGITGILWDFYKWKTSGPAIEVSVKPGMEMIRLAQTPMRQEAKKTYIIIYVRNNGTAPTTIKTIALVTYDSWLSRKRLKYATAGIVPEPAFAKPLPHKLDVGEEWSGVVEQNATIEERIKIGKLWCQIYHTWSKRPVQTRILEKPPKAPAIKQRAASNVE
jgi:hypothetical protein